MTGMWLGRVAAVGRISDAIHHHPGGKGVDLDISPLTPEVGIAVAEYLQPGVPSSKSIELLRGVPIIASRAKLLLDIEQLGYLLVLGRLPPCFWALVSQLHQVMVANHHLPMFQPFFLSVDDFGKIGAFYNTRVFVPQSALPRPSLGQPEGAGFAVLHPSLRSAAHIEHAYTRADPGFVVVDDFLSQPALESLLKWMRESTIWNDVKPGYYGSYVGDVGGGLLNDQLVRLVGEMRHAFPNVIGNLPLRNLWAYKFDSSRPEGIGIHADDAQVNCNIWLVPDDANLDDSRNNQGEARGEGGTGGGMTVWLREPGNTSAATATGNSPTWGSKYNNPASRERLLDFVADAPKVSVPYRTNRLVMFKSTLLHKTDAHHFRPGYENRRISLTLLFGARPGTPEHDCFSSTRRREEGTTCDDAGGRQRQGP